MHVAFAAAAAVSLTLVVSYLRVVTGVRQARWLPCGAAQVVFLVLFSYAFFFEGFTGLTITIGAIVTLFVLMQMTARVSWDDVFAGARCETAEVPMPPVAEAPPASRQHHLTISVVTREATEFVDLTPTLVALVQTLGVRDGLLTRADPAHDHGRDDQRARTAPAR